jgi:site-specific DNA-methyltransferase (adenine-specific)
MVSRYVNRLIQGDCLEVMKNIPDKSVDMTFADPPFNLGKKYNSYNDNIKVGNYLDWSKKWMSELVRITKSTGSIFVHNIPKWLIYYSAFLNEISYFKYWIVWDAIANATINCLQPVHYGILYYVKDLNKNKLYDIRCPHKRCKNCGHFIKNYKDLHPFGPLVSDVWTDINRVRSNKYKDKHPCQLPTSLLDRLILMSTDENDIILDPFVGTGTTAICAKRLGRKFIGIDIDKDYLEIAQNKLLKESADSKIGNAWVSFYLGKIVTIRDADWMELSQLFSVPDKIKYLNFAREKIKRQIELIT